MRKRFQQLFHWCWRRCICFHFCSKLPVRRKVTFNQLSPYIHYIYEMRWQIKTVLVQKDLGIRIRGTVQLPWPFVPHVHVFQSTGIMDDILWIIHSRQQCFTGLGMNVATIHFLSNFLSNGVAQDWSFQWEMAWFEMRTFPTCSVNRQSQLRSWTVACVAHNDPAHACCSPLNRLRRCRNWSCKLTEARRTV